MRAVRGRRNRALLVAVLVGAGWAPGAEGQESPESRAGEGVAVACRCAERELADYWSRADEVLFGLLVDSRQAQGVRRLEMQVLGRPWKTSSQRAGSPPRGGDTVVYRTPVSTAACGIQPSDSAVYVVFAHGEASPGSGEVDPVGSDGESLPIDACTGTRVLRSPSMEAPQGFTDVPGPFVSSRLDALHGADALAGIAADAPDPTDPENRSLVGLLDLEALAHGGTVPVRASPAPEALVIATVSSYDEVQAREVGYEVPAAVGLARIDGWTRIHLIGGARGWVAPEDAGTWFPYAELPVGRLAYLTGSWTGHLWPGAGAGIPARSSRTSDPPEGRREEYAVRVHESTRVGGSLWFRVDLLTTHGCDGGEVQTELSGWVPGWGRGGEPTVWYYSRGC